MTSDFQNSHKPSDHELWTVRRILESAVEWLKSRAVDKQLNPRLDSELILSSVLQLDRMRLYLELDRPVSKVERDSCRSLLLKRASGVPIAHLVGYRDFYRNRFTVSSDTLIPRPDTECLVEAAVDFIRTMPTSRVLDIGTGSGCIALSIAAECPATSVEAWDVSDGALVVARDNALRLGLKNIVIKKQNALDEASYVTSNFDVIVSNPPYIPWSERALCSAETLNFEPPEALFAPDDDGLTFYRVFAHSCAVALSENGRIFLEVGFTQAEKVAQLFEDKRWRKIVKMKDLSGRDRVISALRP